MARSDPFKSILLGALVAALLVGGIVWLMSLERVSRQTQQDPTAPIAASLAPGPVIEAPDAAAPSSPAGIAIRVDQGWLTAVAQATGIPARALAAYAGAQLRLADEAPSCRIGWNTLAGIGRIESGHGSHGGASIDAEGVVAPPILGIQLDGSSSAVINDSDNGALDGDAEWDRAVGPMQFIPDTWSRWGADGNADGVTNPHQIDDAALAAARYLCASGDLSGAERWRAAIFSYNHSEQYVTDVADAANAYAGQVG
ncbi:lytic murein transglycosylase [Salinibacterium sp. ZJ454]|uniref:lytic transglycosylase domain-containing protein n=1 Tax=Salinibacterium sp. ZJ454 TaxID=2708339 RepID=UPI001FBAC3DE|nr:lytic murein transglycosylase [Salinibacterium sp. ZJ454]